ncbi:peptidase T [Pediococcus argentinicus]|uniref:Peptidase T n=1 Tax=Pediococcus argentinicus TaxID=480391 RepID=A0A0R2NJG7_9LACO|nr:peptidase T [Pediococcus argentinicus]KRO25937.1 pepT protein [Pediococcus argentinicus]NKZ21812.1 peptidase T [Pediococcus argentinicus]GEP18928.1 peptidase T [Pediococcus argentinicus]
MAKYETLLPRFLKYVKVNTRSNPNSDTIPTDPKEVTFLKTLAAELEEVGVKDVHTQASSGYVVGTLPANDGGKTPTIGYISHVDTADFNAENIQPQVHENYDGTSDIDLSGDGKWVLKPSVFPSLKKYNGQTLITTDGTTLLGSDDKSGVADIMTMLDYYKAHPEVKHGELRIGFAPDEETGTGADHFDAKDFNTKYAYTVDGGPLGELEYETFNAAQATIDIQGNEVHTAVAKGLMVNALQLGIDYHNLIPEGDRPELTEGREGFYHLFKMSGTPDHAQLIYIIRDHDRKIFEERKRIMQEVADKINYNYDELRVSVEVHDQYYNMREVLEKDMTPVELAQKAMENLDIKPDIYPVRGGTDGSKISFMGIPTPNLFAGGENMHSRFEYVSVQTMERAVDTLLEINRLNTEQAN